MVIFFSVYNTSFLQNLVNYFHTYVQTQVSWKYVSSNAYLGVRDSSSCDNWDTHLGSYPSYFLLRFCAFPDIIEDNSSKREHHTYHIDAEREAHFCKNNRLNQIYEGSSNEP